MANTSRVWRDTPLVRLGQEVCPSEIPLDIYFSLVSGDVVSVVSAHQSQTVNCVQ